MSERKQRLMVLAKRNNNLAINEIEGILDHHFGYVFTGYRKELEKELTNSDMKKVKKFLSPVGIRFRKEASNLLNDVLTRYWREDEIFSMDAQDRNFEEAENSRIPGKYYSEQEIDVQIMELQNRYLKELEENETAWRIRWEKEYHHLMAPVCTRYSQEIYNFLVETLPEYEKEINRATHKALELKPL